MAKVDVKCLFCQQTPSVKNKGLSADSLSLSMTYHAELRVKCMTDEE